MSEIVTADAPRAASAAAEKATAERAGEQKGVSHEAIFLKLYSPHVPRLSLVDLPGVTTRPVQDPPIDIEQQLRSMVMQFIS